MARAIVLEKAASTRRQKVQGSSSRLIMNAAWCMSLEEVEENYEPAKECGYPDF